MQQEVSMIRWLFVIWEGSKYHVYLDVAHISFVSCSEIAEILGKLDQMRTQDHTNNTDTSTTVASNQQERIKLSFKDEYYKKKMFESFRKLKDDTNYKENADKIFREFVGSGIGVQFEKYNKSTGKYYPVNEVDARRSKRLYLLLF